MAGRIATVKKEGLIIRRFDPWRSKSCTCGPKLTFNPYTGCAHGCLYCYITSYIPNAFSLRTKKGLLGKVERDLESMDISLPVALSNSSDPYPPLERELGLMRRILQMFRDAGVKTMIVTKSDIVSRDLDILADMKCVVCFSFTTLDDGLARALEPGAPPPKLRLSAAKRLKKAGIPVVVRVDPVIPGLNDSENAFDLLFSKLEGTADHIVASTFKPRWDGFRRMERRFPRVMSSTRELYERRGNSWLLREDVRLAILARLRERSLRHGMTFATCRENMTPLHTAPSCDGMHLVYR